MIGFGDQASASELGAKAGQAVSLSHVRHHLQHIIRRFRPVGAVLRPAHVVARYWNQVNMHRLRQALAQTTDYAQVSLTDLQHWAPFEQGLVRQIGQFSQSADTHDIQMLTRLIGMYEHAVTHNRNSPSISAREAIQILYRMNQSLYQNSLSTADKIARHLKAMSQLSAIALSAEEYTEYSINRRLTRNYRQNRHAGKWQRALVASHQRSRRGTDYIHPENLALDTVQESIETLLGTNQDIDNADQDVTNASIRDRQTKIIYDALMRAMTDPYELIKRPQD